MILVERFGERKLEREIEKGGKEDLYIGLR